MQKLTEVFAVLKPDLSVDTVPVSPSIYQEIDQRYEGFKGHVLVAAHEFTRDWPTWERHPAGDEIVVLLSGRVEMVLRTATGNESVTLSEPGSYIVVSANTWHTAKTEVPTRMLFATPGEGTENRAEV